MTFISPLASPQPENILTEISLFGRFYFIVENKVVVHGWTEIHKLTDHDLDK